MTSSAPSLKAALRSPLLPLWLVPALLPFGRSAELGVVLCLLGVVLLFAREPGAFASHPGARLFTWMLGAYFGAALISSLDAIAPGKAWGTVAAILRFLPLGLYACFAIRRERKAQAIYRATAVVIGLWALDAWVQALTGWSLGGHAEAERLSGIFGADNLKLGPTLAVLAPFGLWAARERWGRVGLILGFGFLLGPVLLAGSRAAWVCYAIVGLAFAWREAGRAGRFLAWVAAAAVLALIAGGIAWEVSAPFHARMQRTLMATHGNSASVDEALSGRLDIWRDAMRMSAEHPLNGVGVRGFRFAYPAYAPANDHFVVEEPCGVGQGACHPHQVLLEVLAETGAIGLVLWLAAAALAIRCWWISDAAAKRRAFPVTVALGAMLFPLNTHLAFYAAWWGLLCWWLVGLWCAALYADLDEPDDA